MKPQTKIPAGRYKLTLKHTSIKHNPPVDETGRPFPEFTRNCKNCSNFVVKRHLKISGTCIANRNEPRSGTDTCSLWKSGIRCH